MSEGCRRRKDRIERVLVMSGMVKRLAMASRRKALRMVEPFWLGSGMMAGLAAGDLEARDDIVVGWGGIWSCKGMRVCEIAL